ncbi:hypothetical protein [uncultured Bradyrhizobium sp.]|uniref:hypothetical protein n=1 Tax=uncultured Bradyrhizobium sp. TaxID=199684 RepID=UPI0035CA165A
MALSQPFDLFGDFPGWITSFDLKWRQEQSTQASGRIIVKDLGTPLWTLKAQSKQLSPNTLDYWRARLNAMENGLSTFYGYSLSRTFPIKYPNRSWPTGSSFSGTTAAVSAININRKAIAVASLPAGYVISIGDYVKIGATDLHQAMESATANGGGVTPQFEVRPHIWPGVSGGAVSVRKPSCIMAIVPGSLSSEAGLNGWGSISFSAIEART